MNPLSGLLLWWNAGQKIWPENDGNKAGKIWGIILNIRSSWLSLIFSSPLVFYTISCLVTSTISMIILLSIQIHHIIFLSNKPFLLLFHLSYLSYKWWILIQKKWLKNKIKCKYAISNMRTNSVKKLKFLCEETSCWFVAKLGLQEMNFSWLQLWRNAT